MTELRATPKQQLTLFDSVCIILGIVIGAGIYETTPLIAQSVPNAWWLISAWFAGGLISLIGAVCYAELTTTYPYEGGDYVFLTRAYGRRTGFLFTWAGFWMVRPANIGAIAYIFARYANQIWPLSPGPGGLMAYAIVAVVLLTLVNICGVQSGKWTQNLVTVSKVLGLLLIIVIGMFLTMPQTAASTGDLSHNSADLGFAMILILFTYGGWSNISYVAAEVRHPDRNISRSLLLSTLLITLIYIAINLAFVRSLGFTGVAASTSVASDVVSLFHKGGAVLISILICITCIGNINGMILTDARIYYALGQDHHLYRWLGTWSRRFDAPVWALVLQAAVSLALIVGLGGQSGAFQRLVIFSAPLHWFFFLLVALSLIILRKRDSHIKRRYAVLGYPFIPVLFCLSALFMLYASLAYAWEHKHPEAYWIIVVLLIGALFSLYDPPMTRKKS
jgi:basic amino acid/polyamine antiporter, APA family